MAAGQDFPLQGQRKMRLSCIIPAYNEATRIAAVLDVAVGHALIHEVIVVDDGSTDDTARMR